MHRWKIATNPEELGRQIETTPKEMDAFLVRYGNATLENKGEMTEALEAFVMNYWDGFTIVNDHLSLQMSQIWRPMCPEFRLDAIHDLGDMNSVFENLLSDRGIPKSQESEKLNVKSLRLKEEMLSRKLLRKICQLQALDYCCLNFRLPPVCDEAVKCQWKKADEGTPGLFIEPVSPFPAVNSDLALDPPKITIFQRKQMIQRKAPRG